MEQLKIIALIAAGVVFIVFVVSWFSEMSSDYSPGDEYEIIPFDFNEPQIEPEPRCLEQESLLNLQNSCCGACEVGCEVKP